MTKTPPLVQVQAHYKEVREMLKTRMLLQAKHEEIVAKRLAASKPNWLMVAGIMACGRSLYESISREIFWKKEDEEKTESGVTAEESKKPAVEESKEHELPPVPRLLFYTDSAPRFNNSPIQNEQNRKMRRDFMQEMRLRDNGKTLRTGTIYNADLTASRGPQVDPSLAIPVSAGSGEHIYLAQ